MSISVHHGYQWTTLDPFARCRSESRYLQGVTLSTVAHPHNVRGLAPLDADSSCRFRDLSSPLLINVTVNTAQFLWCRRFHDVSSPTTIESLVAFYGLGLLALRARVPAGRSLFGFRLSAGLGVTCLYVFQGSTSIAKGKVDPWRTETNEPTRN